MKKNKKQCYFCSNNISYIDYRDVELLKKFTDDYGKIQHQKKTGLSSPFQRKLEKAIKRARYMALLPYINL